ncbi:MAG TPA: TetR family transcriptional regulator C-terminal domain-containing protein, partial [Gemmataceae bacterium]|nr:TetR family transcriptional regulator C-terminal domain-containing protein [Gemmataceae bacterium]
QLTYYFPTKEEILLAVFDHLLQLLHQRAHGCLAAEVPQEPGWERFLHFFRLLMLQPPDAPEFHSLQYTFLSQIGHREDFRLRLAKLYEEWRSHGTEHLERDLAERPAVRPVSPRALDTLVQAILHGLAMQSAVDPQAIGDAGEMAHLCLDMLRTYLWDSQPQRKKKLAVLKS